MKRIRYTAYSDEFPAGHGESVREAVAEARRRLRSDVRVTRIDKRLRGYPYTTLNHREVSA